MSDTEQLHFKITMAGTFWNKRPAFAILINDDLVQQAVVTTQSEENFVVEFDWDIKEGPHVLKIRLENKDDSDVQKDKYDDPENFKIIGDMLLNIRNIEIDEIDLASILYSKSKFVADDPSRPTLDTCVDLGWNGTWELAFTSPFYIWLLENI